ncbi:MAG: sigma 54-interacting transcriptional regulator [Myxococcota bacterium]|nr:sigma 54-interacting transcriptional regulator [Myxococcota bacterium]
MPTLTWRPNGEDRESHAISKSITTIGSDASNDVVLSNKGVVGRRHAQIVFDGRMFSISEVDNKCPIAVNGKQRRKSKLSHDDRINIGDVEMLFRILSTLGRQTSDPITQSAIEGLRQLQTFSAKLMAHEKLSDILDELMDSVISLMGASKGFLVLCEDGRPEIKVARNLHRENVEDAISQMSDSIVSQVLETKTPIIVSDAMNDTQFRTAESVINLKLNSVMCVPLLERGRLLGVIYVGNDSIKGLFEARSLDLLSVFAAQASMVVQNALLLDDLRLKNKSLSEELKKQRFGEIIGNSKPMLEVFRKVEKVATADVSVLITGETGTGKELIAREIHRRSQRFGGPIVTVNCGAIPESLMESEFFGHVRGAFTGAVSTRAGKFQAADKGTIFLDEIGEMPLSLQVKLLRVIQERQVVKVGATKPEPLDIRIIAASNRNLSDEVAAKRFREDLFYRLNVVHIDLPAVRDRDDDIVLIARFLLKRYVEEFDSSAKGFTPGAIRAIRRYHWPGNVRELENRLKKAVILCDGTMIGPGDLDLGEETLPEILPLAEAKEKFQQEYVRQVLAHNNGNRSKTARDLNVDPRTIFRYLEKA